MRVARPPLLACLTICLASGRLGVAQDASEVCPSYLGTGENGLGRCDMQAQDYLSGSWQQIPGHCQPKTIEEANAWAYPYKYDCNPTAHRCSAEDDTCRKKLLDIVKWSWYPDRCSLEAFNAAKLSHTLGNRYVLVLGDSLMAQQFVALADLMRPAISEHQDPQPAWEHFYTQNGGLFQFEGVQFLVGDTMNGSADQPLEVLPESTWIKMVDNADIVMFNTGHHWHRRDKSFIHWTQMQRNVLAVIKQRFKGTHIILRTSTWGHPACDTMAKPLEDEVQALQSVAEDPFKWMQPIQIESDWHTTIEEAELTDQFRVVNASITMLRGDAHVDLRHGPKGNPFVDCLHNCFPGPPDWWNLVMYNTLVSLDLQPLPKSRKPVNYLQAAASAKRRAQRRSMHKSSNYKASY